MSTGIELLRPTYDLELLVAAHERHHDEVRMVFVLRYTDVRIAQLFAVDLDDPADVASVIERVWRSANERVLAVSSDELVQERHDRHFCAASCGGSRQKPQKSLGLLRPAALSFGRVAAETFIAGLGGIVTWLLRALQILIALVLGAAIAGAALAIPAGVAFFIYKAYPGDLPAQADPGWLDIIFANRFVVYAGRIVLIGLALLLLVAAIYIATSMFVRMYRREWLHKAGPFEADVVRRADEGLEDVGDAYRGVLEDAWSENEELAQRLEGALRDLEDVSAERNELVERLAEYDADR